MGTSTGYKAPTTPDWGNLKSKVTRAARSGAASNTSANDTLRDFIRTSGGARSVSRGGGAMGGGRSAQNTASRVGGFISSVGSIGLDRTLQSYGLSALVDKLGGSASTGNDSDARNALSKVMDELLGDLDTPEQVEETLEQVMSGEALENLLSKFFGYYLYEQFCRVFYERLVKSVGRENADSYLGNISDTIKSSLRLKSSDKDLSKIDWSGAEGQRIADQILQDTYEIFGG